jgi:hypothetical protein
MIIATAPVVTNVSGPSGGSVVLTATVSTITTGVHVPAGLEVQFTPLVGTIIERGPFLTDGDGNASCTLSLAGVPAPQDSTYTAHFVGGIDPTNPDDSFGSSDSDPGQLSVTVPVKPPEPPGPSPGTTPAEATGPDSAFANQPGVTTDLAEPDAFTGTANVDPFTGQPAANAFTGLPDSSDVPQSVRDFINQVFSQPPVDYSGVPQSVQDFINDVFAQDPVDFSGVPQSVQDFVNDAFAQPAVDSSFFDRNFDYAAQSRTELGPLSSAVQGLDQAISEFGKALRLALRAFQGGLRAVGGLGQIAEGLTFAVLTAESGVGLAAGLLYAANGLDQLTTGIDQALGEDAETYTSRFVEFATGSSAAGRAADALIPLAGGLGLGAVSAISSEASALERTALSGVSTAVEETGLANPGRVFPEFPDPLTELAAQAERLPAATAEEGAELATQAERLPAAVPEQAPVAQAERLPAPVLEQVPAPVPEQGAGAFTPSWAVTEESQAAWASVKLSDLAPAESRLVSDVVNADQVILGRSINVKGRGLFVLDSWLEDQGIQWSQRWQDVYNRALFARTSLGKPVNVIAGGGYTLGEVTAAETGARVSGIYNIPYWSPLPIGTPP